MPSDVLSCPICYTDYNDNENMPRVIPHCGHTICAYCLKMIIANPTTAKCPLDNKSINFPNLNLEMFPINFIVKQLYHDKPSRQTCHNHSGKLRLVCMTDGCYVCDECVFEGDHKGHDVKPRKKFDEEAQQKKKELEKAVKNLSKYQDDLEEVFDNRRNELIMVIREKFQELRWALVKKEIELSLEVNSLFDAEKKGKGCEMEVNSEYINNILIATNDLKEAIDGRDNFAIMDMDLEKMKINIDEEVFFGQFQQLQRKLNNLTVTFLENLKKEVDGIAHIKSPLEDIMGTVSLEHVLEYKPSELLRTGNLMAASLISKYINIEEHGEVLLVSVCGSSTQKLDVKDIISNFNEWNKFTKVHVKLNKGDGLSEGVQGLAYLWANLSTEITWIKIECGAKEITDRDLGYLFAISLENSSNITEFQLDLCDVKVGDASLKPLTEEFLPRMIRLKSLMLNFNATLVTDNTLRTLGCNVQPVLRRLESFDLRLNEARVTDRGISNIFTKMDKVKKFVLDLGSTGITDESVRSFATMTVPSMKVLEEFKLGLASTNISDQSVSQLFVGMHTVKNFHLFLHGTKITDISVETLARNALPFFHSLEVFEMRVGDTKVSDYGVTQLFNSLETVKKFILKMQSTSVTDRTAEAFTKIGLPRMRSLKEFDIDVSRTGVSMDWAVHLGRVRSSLAMGLQIQA